MKQSNKTLSIYFGLTIIILGSTIFWQPAIYRSILPEDFILRNYLMQGADWGFVLLILGLIIYGEKNKLSTLNIKKFNEASFSLGMALGGISMLYIVAHKLLLAPLIMSEVSNNTNTGADTGLTFLIVFGIFNVITAGIAEEIIYRGYATERLLMLKANRAIAFLLPLAAFVLMHYRKGVEHMVLVVVVGALFQAFYLKYRNLTITIIGHLLIDTLALLAIAIEYFE